MKKNLFVLRINNYWPELCESTIPTIKYWASLNGWDYREITLRVYPRRPPTLEKLQVHTLGEDADWNLLCDADVMLRPDFPDPSLIINKTMAASSYSFKASQKFSSNMYFERDGRDIGISGGFVLTSKLTHDLWEPPKGGDAIDAGLEATSKNTHLIDEYFLSTNLAKYGLNFSGVSNTPDRYIIHFGGTNEEKNNDQKHESVLKARALMLDWATIWPSIVSQ